MTYTSDFINKVMVALIIFLLDPSIYIYVHLAYVASISNMGKRIYKLTLNDLEDIFKTKSLFCLDLHFDTKIGFTIGK